MSYELVLSGALTGFLVGLTGVGGGALMTPVLLIFFQIPPLSAIGTDLWFSAITKIFAGNVGYKKNLIDWNILKYMWLGSISASALTLIFIRLYSIDEVYLVNLKLLVAIVVLFTAITMFFQKYFHLVGLKYRLTDVDHFKKLQKPLTIVAGSILGITVTLTSIGAGALGAVMLAYLYPIRLTAPKLIATDIVHAIPLALFAGIGHLIVGNVDFVLLLNLLLGSIPAVILGAHLSSKLPHMLLKKILATILLAIAIKLLLQ